MRGRASVGANVVFAVADVAIEEATAAEQRAARRDFSAACARGDYDFGTITRHEDGTTHTYQPRPGAKVPTVTVAADGSIALAPPPRVRQPRPRRPKRNARARVSRQS